MPSENDYGNQFNNYAGARMALEFFSSESRTRRFEHVRAILRDNPDGCVIPPRRDTGYRVGKTTRKASWRALAYFDQYGTVPKFGFARSACGNTGCINPLHQVPNKEWKVSVGQFTVISPSPVSVAHV